jgi:hypothetical protein
VNGFIIDGHCAVGAIAHHPILAQNHILGLMVGITTFFLLSSICLSNIVDVLANPLTNQLGLACVDIFCDARMSVFGVVDFSTTDIFGVAVLVALLNTELGFIQPNPHIHSIPPIFNHSSMYLILMR